MQSGKVSPRGTANNYPQVRTAKLFRFSAEADISICFRVTSLQRLLSTRSEGRPDDRRSALSNDMLCSAPKWNLPTREYEHGRMAIEGARKNLGALDTQIYATVLDGGNGSLRNAREFG